MFYRKKKRSEIYSYSRKRKKKEEIVINKPRDNIHTVATGPRKYTGILFLSTNWFNHVVTIALPGSIVANAQGLELKTALVGQIARALVIFCVDEIVIFDDSGIPKEQNIFEKHDGVSDENVFFIHLLRYMETPQYLRKTLFPIHRDLRFTGLLNPLDCPHHLRIDEDFPYREGITLDSSLYPKVPKNCTLVEAGLRQKVLVSDKIKPGVRVTLFMKEMSSQKKYINAEIVSPSTPRETMGYYWGYTVRFASSLSAVLTESPYENGYDLTIGTSERGVAFEEVKDNIPNFNHILIVFGGLAGLEAAVDADQNLDIGGDRVEELFDRWINVCPAQGSRTIRTEEALLITLAQLKAIIMKKGK